MKRKWIAVRAVSVLLVFAGGCSVIAGLDNEYEEESGGAGGSGGSGAGVSCVAREECPPDSDCATWACSAGSCTVAVMADGTPVTAGSIVGDCLKKVCLGGDVATLPDDADLVEDNDPCTVEMCDVGVKQKGPSPDGTACGGTGKLACVNGLCEGCNQDPTNCDPPTECETVECLVNTCISQPKPVGTKVGDNNKPGDCKALVCDGMGAMVEGTDDTDVPMDPDTGDCSYPMCLNGVLNPNVLKSKGDVCTAQQDGKCCGASCCANASAGSGQFCDKNNMCCSSGKQCGGNCCPNASDNCNNNTCCGGSVCNNLCCQTEHACESGTNNCCPVGQRCSDGTCCPSGKTCNVGNMCN